MAKYYSYKLSKSHIIPLLLEYKKYPFLWDPNDENYKKNDDRIRMLKKISHDLGLGMTVGQLRTRLKNLRTTYVREVRRVMRSKKKGEFYRPRLAWFKVADSFLRNVITLRRPETDTESNESVLEETEVSIVPVEDDYEKRPFVNGDVEIEAVIVKQEDFNIESFEAMSNPEESSSIKDDCVETPKINRNSSNLTEYSSRNHISGNNWQFQEDEFDTFGRHVANQLRCLPLCEAVRSQNYINNFLTEERLKVLKNILT